MRRRSRSPLSDPSVRQLLEDDYLSDDFVDQIDNIESESESSESDFIVDNTDSDPDYFPDSLGPSTSGLGSVLGKPRLQIPQHVSSTDTEAEDEPPVPPTQPSQPRPPVQTRRRGRPRTRPRESSSSSSDGAGWDTVDENNDPGYAKPFTFSELPGIKHAPPRNSPPLVYFKLFFTTALLETFVRFTNKYANDFITKNQNNFKQNSRAKKWLPVTILEIQAFLAVLINMGIKRQPTIYSYWWTSSSQYIPYFSRMFSRDRFQAILQFFHMVDTSNLAKPGEPNYNPCARFDPLIDHVNRLFRHYFTPDKNLSIDESIIASKAQTQLRQYMPKKHHRWGVKLWMVCDAVSHYCMNFFVYRGARGADKEEIQEKGLSYFVVVKLLEMGNLLNKGYHIFIDNFFTSMKLAKYLYQKCTAMTGTLRSNRKGIPKDLLSKFEVGKCMHKRKDQRLIVAFREKQSQKKQVLLLSTDETAEFERRTKRRGTAMILSNKPKMIRNYNDFMGGVDGNDQMLCAYLDSRKTIKYWKKVTFSIFGRIILNSYILYKQNTDKPIQRIDYTVQLVEELSKDWLLQKEGRTFTPVRTPGGGGGDAVSPDSFFEKLPNKMEKNCCVCSKASTQAGGKRKKSTFICKRCKKGVHPKCYPMHSC